MNIPLKSFLSRPRVTQDQQSYIIIVVDVILFLKRYTYSYSFGELFLGHTNELDGPRIEYVWSIPSYHRDYYDNFECIQNK